jgi:hypothetical protein
VESPLSQVLQFLHNVLPFLPHHFFTASLGREIKCRFYIPISTCLQFEGLGSALPPKALLAPQLISRKVHKSEAPKNLPLTTPSQQETESPPEETGNYRIGRRQRGCGASEECSPMEGPLGHSTHFTLRGNANHIQRTTKARCVGFFLFFSVFFVILLVLGICTFTEFKLFLLFPHDCNF